MKRGGKKNNWHSFRKRRFRSARVERKRNIASRGGKSVLREAAQAAGGIGGSRLKAQQVYVRERGKKPLGRVLQRTLGTAGYRITECGEPEQNVSKARQKGGKGGPLLFYNPSNLEGALHSGVSMGETVTRGHPEEQNS